MEELINALQASLQASPRRGAVVWGTITILSAAIAVATNRFWSRQLEVTIPELLGIIAIFAISLTIAGKAAILTLECILESSTGEPKSRQLKRAIQNWEETIHLAIANAHNLYENLSIKTWESGEGEMREKADECKTRIGRILGQGLQIKTLVEEAKSIHQTLSPLLPETRKLRRIEELLEGESILNEKPGRTTDLLALPKERIRPIDLLKQMQKEFETVNRSAQEIISPEEQGNPSPTKRMLKMPS